MALDDPACETNLINTVFVQQQSMPQIKSPEIEVVLADHSADRKNTIHRLVELTVLLGMGFCQAAPVGGARTKGQIGDCR